MSLAPTVPTFTAARVFVLQLITENLAQRASLDISRAVPLPTARTLSESSVGAGTSSNIPKVRSI